MQFNRLIHNIIAAYGVGSGNAPALYIVSVGHLLAVFLFLNHKYAKHIERPYNYGYCARI